MKSRSFRAHVVEYWQFYLGGVALLALLAVSASLLLSQRENARDTSKWPTVTAVIRSVTVEAVPGGVVGTLSLSYEAEGRTYESRYRRLWTSPAPPAGVLEVGREVTVRHHPKAPSLVSLEPLVTEAPDAKTAP